MLYLGRSLDKVYIFFQTHMYSVISSVPHQYKNSLMPIFILSVTRNATLYKLGMLI
jgi:hypothetical protein